MSGWRPKSTKTGGLPKLSWEPRKPVHLGKMFRNGVECMSGILVFQDVVQDAEVMKQKEYFGEKSSMPNGMEIPAHAAEVLRQIKGANVVEGGWVGGHRFGSQEAPQRRFHMYNKGQSCFLSYGGIACCDQSSVWDKNCRTLGENDNNYCWYQNDGHGLCLEPERHIVFLVNIVCYFFCT
jgi:hypothetical protein